MNFVTDINYDDVTCALRVQLGFEAHEDEGAILVGALPHPNGLQALQFARSASGSGKSVVILSVDEGWLPKVPPEIVTFQSSEGSLVMRMGLTLWAADESSPLLIISRDDEHPTAVRVGSDGFEDLGPVSVRIDRSVHVGIARAAIRLRRSAVMMAALRKMASMAA